MQLNNPHLNDRQSEPNVPTTAADYLRGRRTNIRETDTTRSPRNDDAVRCLDDTNVTRRASSTDIWAPDRRDSQSRLIVRLKRHGSDTVAV